MSTQASYGIAITGSDQTGKAAKSAERRLGAIPKHAGIANRRYAEEGERSLRRHSRAILRTFGDVEQAGARIFGGRSITSGIAGRLGAVRAAGAAAGTGLGEAAASGGVLSGALGVVGVVASATIGILASAAYAAVSMANGWAKGAASIGRTAEIIGVGTKAMQEFSAAAERVGVDKDKATGTLGSLSQNLNDARYGRNPAATAILGRLGVEMKTNADGTVDVGAMLPAIADALARQNSSGRRTAAQGLGIGLDALPAFTQGSKALAADMADASVHANVLTDDQISTGTRIARKGAIVGQMKDRVLGAAGAASAGVLESGYDATIRGGQAILDGARDFGGTVERSFKPAAEKIDRAANRIGDAISSMKNGVLRLSSKDVVDLKKTVATEWDNRSANQGRGIIDTILNRRASGHWGQSVASVVNAKSQFSDVNGAVAWRQGRRSVDQIPMSRVSRRASRLVDDYLRQREQGVGSSVGDNLNYANPNYSDRRNLAWINKLDGPQYGSGKSVHRHGTTAGLERYRPGAFQVDAPGGREIPVKVEVVLRNAPPGTMTKVTAGSRAKPAVSHAYAPVHGG